LEKEDINEVLTRYRRPLKKERMTRKRIISLIDKGTVLKDHMPDNPYISKLISKNFSDYNKE